MIDLCEPSMEFFMQYDGKQNPYGPNTRYIAGLSGFLDFGQAFQCSAPDFVNLIYEPPVVVYDEETNESFGCFKGLVSMTKVSVIVNTDQQGPTNLVNGELNVLLRCDDFSLLLLY